MRKNKQNFEAHFNRLDEFLKNNLPTLHTKIDKIIKQKTRLSEKDKFQLAITQLEQELLATRDKFAHGNESKKADFFEKLQNGVGNFSKYKQIALQINDASKIEGIIVNHDLLEKIKADVIIEKDIMRECLEAFSKVTLSDLVELKENVELPDEKFKIPDAIEEALKKAQVIDACSARISKRKIKGADDLVPALIELLPKDKKYYNMGLIAKISIVGQIISAKRGDDFFRCTNIFGPMLQKGNEKKWLTGMDTREQEKNLEDKINKYHIVKEINAFLTPSLKKLKNIYLIDVKRNRHRKDFDKLIAFLDKNPDDPAGFVRILEEAYLNERKKYQIFNFWRKDFAIQMNDMSVNQFHYPRLLATLLNEVYNKFPNIVPNKRIEEDLKNFKNIPQNVDKYIDKHNMAKEEKNHSSTHPTPQKR